MLWFIREQLGLTGTKYSCGIGEPTIAVAAPAVLNAIYAATGKCVRRFPLKHSDLRSV